MFIVCLGGGGLGYLLRDSRFAYLLDRQYYDVCHFCHEVLSRGDVVRYLKDLMHTGEFDGWLEVGLKRADSGAPPWKPIAKQRIAICNGKRCGRDDRAYPLIHYAFNRLVETGKNRFIGVEVSDCLNACSNGPNLLVTTSGCLVGGVTFEKIDKLIDELSPEESREGSNDSLVHFPG
jgi:(2Fe-2S) ferredoxin